eukprot:CAMPEP_0174266918 /NCGR_PEP_ID=MMETSP0439-20130205/31904_1 /TAXON_ID=0 /ORGANISM="Stereomyxa ramosa, Strain Chinc5" /LENGTH=234 /DNA_ID=CAMNT_0015354167 /DNA_START=119 /DNA_END=823 /DNA_ORIENTATION=-
MSGSGIAKELVRLMNINQWKNFPEATAILANAAREGNFATAQKVLQEMQGMLGTVASLNLWTEEGFTLAHIAGASNKWEFMDWMLQLGVDLNLPDAHGQTILHRVCAEGTNEQVIQLISRGANIASVDTVGSTPLHVAGHRGDVQILTTLLSVMQKTGKSELVNVVCDCGWTPLHYAAERGHQQAVNLLLAFGAHCQNAEFCSQQKPIDMASNRSVISSLQTAEMNDLFDKWAL